MASNRINLTIARATGRTSKASMKADDAIMARAEELLQFMTTGEDPREARLVELAAQVERLDAAVNYATGALLDPDAKRRMAAIAEVTERVHLAYNPGAAPATGRERGDGSDEEFVEKWAGRLMEEWPHWAVGNAEGWSVARDFVREELADLRASTPPAAPAFSSEEREALEWLRYRAEVQAWNGADAGRRALALAAFDRLLASPARGGEVSPTTEVLDPSISTSTSGHLPDCHDPSHQTCDPTPAPPLTVAPRVDEAFMRRWTERLDVNRNEVRRLLEEAGVGVEPAKEQTP